MMKSSLYACLLMSAIMLGGCGTHRGLPSHGGGKRFDEEQRAVSASIRQAVAGIDLSALRGQRVQLSVSGIAHNGGGKERFPGPIWANAGGFSNHGSDDTTGLSANGASAPAGWNPSWRNLATNASRGITGTVGLRLEQEYESFQVWTDADMNYLEQVVRMHLLHQGVICSDRDPQARLVVLVDVLGTNRNRTELILASADCLQSSCELTYYVTAPDESLMHAARRSGARSEYSERGVLLVQGLAPRRKTEAGCVGDMAMP